jgi:hypothetical protein
MKYLLTPWKAKTGNHQFLLENRTPTKTTHIRGYGFGVTFSSRCFVWSHSFSSTSTFLQYSAPDFTS